MLRSISIRNLAVVAAADVHFQPGLTVLSGETGVGKSIVLDAVDLLLGGRASTDVIRTGETAAHLSATFDLPDGPLTLTRDILTSGRGRATVNGATTATARLRELAGGLVELQGQHEHLALLDPGAHRRLLDAYLRPRAELDEVAAAWRGVQDARARLDRSRLDAGERQRRLDRIHEELREIDAVAPRAGELDDLQATRSVLAHADRIQRLCLEGYDALYGGEVAAMGGLAAAWKRVAELATLDPAFQVHADARDAIKGQLEDLADAFRDGGGRVEDAAARLEAVESRLAALERLLRKFGPGLEDVLAMADRAREEQRLLTNPAGEAAALEGAHAAACDRYRAAASVLSARRKAGAPGFAHALERLLHDLAMEHARVEVRFGEADGDPASWTEDGFDHPEFYLSANLGEAPRPLGRVISGGELSRAALALRTLTASASGGQTLIFDEVDAGLGGRTADVVGQCLRRLAAGFQVIAITHVPQIAAYADHQIRIRKETSAGRTISSVDHLDAAGRRDEIARMLAGATVTDAARRAADQLLTAARAATGAGESKHKAKAKP